MSFLQDKRKRERKKIITRNILFVVIIFLVGRFGFPDFFHKLFSNIFAPVLVTEEKLEEGASLASKHLVSKRSLIKENQELRNEIDKINTMLLDFEITKTENSKLRDLVGGFDDIGNYNVAKVISRPPISFYDTLVVDLGEEDGIYVGQKIYVNNTIVIGEVLEVYKNSSLVSLYSTPEKETRVTILPSNTVATLVGRGGGSYEASVPRDLVITPGMITVLESSRNNEIVALAMYNISDPRDPLNTVLFRSPVNFNNIDFVAIK